MTTHMRLRRAWRFEVRWVAPALASGCLLGADPLSDFPDHDLAERAVAGARTVISVDTIPNATTRRAEMSRVDGNDRRQATVAIPEQMAFLMIVEIGKVPDTRHGAPL